MAIASKDLNRASLSRILRNETVTPKVGNNISSPLECHSVFTEDQDIELKVADGPLARPAFSYRR